MTYLVLIAGGIGNRLGAGKPKQFVEVLGKDKLSFDCVAGVAAAQGGVGTGGLGLGVASLNHEVIDYAVEEHAVIEAFLDQLDEVVAVLGRLVVELDHDVAQRGFEFNFCHVIVVGL